MKNTTTEELRLRNYKASLQQKSEIDLREMQARQSDETQRITENHQMQMDDLKRAYDVQISQEAEALEEHLHKFREVGHERIENEKHSLDTEFDKVKTASQQKIDEYKKNSEAQLDKLRRETQASSDLIHDRGKKALAAKREKEGTPA